MYFDLFETTGIIDETFDISQYYNYYEINRELPNEAINKYMEHQSKLIVSTASYIPYMTTSQGVTALAELGISETSTRLSARLATLGIVSSLDGPLPVADLIALIAGVVIVTEYIVDHLDDNSSAVEDKIEGWYGASYAKTASNAIASSASLQANINRGYDHFYARLANINGSGGIYILNPFQSTLDAAVYLEGKGDVWSTSDPLAMSVADAASLGSSPVKHGVHNQQNQPLNRPHWHATLLFIQIGGHSFY